MLTNASGEPTATFTYSAYGQPAGSTGAQTTPLGYAGQLTNEQSGLQYLRARVYDPATGQFLTRDPLDYLTQTPYAYAEDNPLLYVDPKGSAASTAETQTCANDTLSYSECLKAASLLTISGFLARIPILRYEAGALALHAALELKKCPGFQDRMTPPNDFPLPPGQNPLVEPEPGVWNV